MSAGGTDEQSNRPRGRGWALAGLALLLLLGLFYVFGAISDLIADAGSGIPVDHRGTFTALTGSTFDHTKVTAPGTASYITTLERGYAQPNLPHRGVLPWSRLRVDRRETSTCPLEQISAERGRGLSARSAVAVAEAGTSCPMRQAWISCRSGRCATGGTSRCGGCCCTPSRRPPATPARGLTPRSDRRHGR